MLTSWQIMWCSSTEKNAGPLSEITSKTVPSTFIKAMQNHFTTAHSWTCGFQHFWYYLNQTLKSLSERGPQPRSLKHTVTLYLSFYTPNFVFEFSWSSMVGYCVRPRWKVWQDWGLNWISQLTALQIHKLRNCSHKASPSQSCYSHPSSSSEPSSVFPLFVLTQTFAQVKSYQETVLVINMQISFQLSVFQLHPHAVTNPFASIQRRRGGKYPEWTSISYPVFSHSIRRQHSLAPQRLQMSVCWACCPHTLHVALHCPSTGLIFISKNWLKHQSMNFPETMRNHLTLNKDLYSTGH